MPAKISMFIPKGGYTLPQMSAPVISPNIAPAPKSAAAPTPLNSAMIGRINSVRPGCGSCGRH